MTVEKLINKLKKCNPNAIVVIANNEMYINGSYEVTDIDYYGDEVEIATDYVHRLQDD